MARTERIYGYCRVSTMKQSIQRQIDNIKKVYPDAVIIAEEYTGTTMQRPKWIQLEKTLREGDTVVFDEISRMSRDAEEGFKTYKDLYERGVRLVFLKESTMNTENFRKAAQVPLVGGAVDYALDGINKMLMALAEEQFKAAFATAQHEVDFLHQRTKEGVRRAQAAGKRVGLAPGSKVETKKAKAAKAKILQHSKDFGGSLGDSDLMQLVGCSRNSLYKYKRELREAQH